MAVAAEPRVVFAEKSTNERAVLKRLASWKEGKHAIVGKGGVLFRQRYDLIVADVRWALQNFARMRAVFPKTKKGEFVKNRVVLVASYGVCKHGRGFGPFSMGSPGSEFELVFASRDGKLACVLGEFMDRAYHPDQARELLAEPPGTAELREARTPDEGRAHTSATAIPPAQTTAISRAPGDFIYRAPPTEARPGPDPRNLNVVHRGVYFFVAALRTTTGRELTTPYPDLAQLIANELAADARAMSKPNTVTALHATTLDVLAPWSDHDFVAALEAEIHAAKELTGLSEEVARVIRDAVDFYEASRELGRTKWLERAALSNAGKRSLSYAAALHAHRHGWPMIPALVGRGHARSAIREAMLALWPAVGSRAAPLADRDSAAEVVADYLHALVPGSNRTISPATPFANVVVREPPAPRPPTPEPPPSAGIYISATAAESLREGRFMLRAGAGAGEDKFEVVRIEDPDRLAEPFTVMFSEAEDIELLVVPAALAFRPVVVACSDGRITACVATAAGDAQGTQRLISARKRGFAMPEIYDLPDRRKDSEHAPWWALDMLGRPLSRYRAIVTGWEQEGPRRWSLSVGPGGDGCRHTLMLEATFTKAGLAKVKCDVEVVAFSPPNVHVRRLRKPELKPEDARTARYLVEKMLGPAEIEA